MSQFREGSFGRLESHEGGIPVNLRTERMPEIVSPAGGAGCVGRVDSEILAELMAVG
jgi:hypothetical protein